MRGGGSLRLLENGAENLLRDRGESLLGSGTGIVGIAAAATLGTNVTVTDLPHVLPNILYNISLNAGVLKARGGNVEAGNCQESKGEKARRKAEEKRQARLEKELVEEEERKQREEVARLVEEQRKLTLIQRNQKKELERIMSVTARVIMNGVNIPELDLKM